MDIVQNFYNAYSTPKSFFVEKDFDSWDPKIRGPCNYLLSFYVAALIDICSTTKHYSLAMFQNGISIKTRSSVTVNMDDGIPLSFSDSVSTSKREKNRHTLFKIQMKKHCSYLKAKYDALFKIRSKIPAFVLNPLKSMLNLVVDRISLQKLEYEMKPDDIPDDYNLFEIEYCGHPDFPYAHI